MKGILKVVSNIVTSLLFVMLICAVFAVIISKASGGEANLFGYQFKTVLSGSMEPNIQTGSVIAVRQTKGQPRFEKGDVVTYKAKDDILITHRIVKVKGNGKQYITKGDHNNAADPDPVPAGNIVGEYTGYTMPYLGYAMNFAASKEGNALLLILPGLLLIGYAAFTIWRAFRQIGELKQSKSTTDTK